MYNVSWLMKNFIDRFAYICHRPRFHGKKALVVSTTGGVGLEVVLPLLGSTVSTWGFEVVGKVGLRVPPGTPGDGVESLIRDAAPRLRSAATRFYAAMASAAPQPPSVIGLTAFRLQREAFASGESSSSVDYEYWRDKGWFEKNCRYYYPVKTSPAKNFLAGLLLRAFKVLIVKMGGGPRL